MLSWECLFWISLEAQVTQIFLTRYHWHYKFGLGTKKRGHAHCSGVTEVPTLQDSNRLHAKNLDAAMDGQVA